MSLRLLIHAPRGHVQRRQRPPADRTKAFVRPSHSQIGFCLFALALFLATQGCATGGLSLRQLNGMVVQNNYAQAAAAIEKARSSYGSNNLLLYDLDRALLLQWAGDPVRSNEAFESAKRTAQALVTKSVSAEAVSFMTSDNARAYAGEDFERALIHVFAALNYSLLDRAEDALVECRQLDFLFKTLRTESRGKTAYTDDAFARYWAGLLYEEQGQINDAFISYYKALEVYEQFAKNYRTPRPRGLLADALRTARTLNFSDEIRSMEKRWGTESVTPPRPNDGELIVLHAAGLSPEKVDSFLEIGVIKGWGYVQEVQSQGEEDAQVQKAGAIVRGLAADKIIRVALPVYKTLPYRISGFDLSLDSATTAGALVHDVGAVARRSLEDRMGKIRARAIARATVKYLLTQTISDAVAKNDENTGAWVRLILQATAAATESADKRAWHTLPDRLLLARLFVPEGRHNLTLTFRDAAGTAIRTVPLEGVEVRRGRRTFQVVRTAD